MKVKHLVGAFLCVLGCYACSSPKTEVQSPDGHIKMTLTVDENGKPFYNDSGSFYSLPTAVSKFRLHC